MASPTPAANGSAVGSQKHPDFATLEPLLQAYPAQSAPLFHTYVDLVHSARWSEVVPIDLKAGFASAYQNGSHNTGSGWGALRGRRPDGKKLETVIPCHISDTLSVAYFDNIFASLAPVSSSAASDRAGIETGHILLAMLSADSTVVYYKLASGLVKPVN